MLVRELEVTTKNHAPTVRRWLLAALVLALLFSQAVGVLHRTLHAPAPPSVAAFHHESAQASELDAGTGLAALFPHLADESTCRLFDVVTSPGVSASVHEFVPIQAGSPGVATAVAQAVAEASSHFDARGPPALS